MTIFLRLLKVAADRKADALVESASAWRASRNTDGTYQVAPESFGQVPGAAFAYWVSDEVRGVFKSIKSLEETGRAARTTSPTYDDTRWIRAIWEVDLTGPDAPWRWVPFFKGGAYAPFYYCPHLCIQWDSTVETYPGYLGSKHRPDVRPASSQFFFRPGLTWPSRTGGLSFRALPAQCAFGVKSPAAFVPGDDSVDLLATMAVLNSRPFAALVELVLARTTLAQSYEVGLIQNTPFPALPGPTGQRLAELAQRYWHARRRLDVTVQTSLRFLTPALLWAQSGTLRGRAKLWMEFLGATDAECVGIRSEIDRVAFGLYAIHGEDRRQMEEGFGSLGSGDEETEGNGAEKDDPDDEVEGADPVALTEALLEWTLGVALGRFDVRLATGERQPPPDPDPFDPLPVSSPGMLQDDADLPASVAPPGYPLELPPHGILVDDPGHPWDVVSRMEAVLDLVAGEHAHGWIQEAEAILGRVLRDWLRRYGFERHLKRYSRSRRKAPLFWHLGPKSREYGLWLYSPAATRDTVYRILNDYVDPKLKGAERRLLELRQDAGPSPTGQQRKDLTAQESLVEDLRAFRQEVDRVAPLWTPFRDDGVVLNCAVLWRLFDHHRPWQKECKKKWGELAKGQYDWAGWAMHLWPERVVKTSASDRSIAIAHGLEEALWEEDDDGKWKPRPDAREQEARLTAERHSTAMQAALDDFIRAG